MTILSYKFIEFSWRYFVKVICCRIAPRTKCVQAWTQPLHKALSQVVSHANCLWAAELVSSPVGTLFNSKLSALYLAARQAHPGSHFLPILLNYLCWCADSQRAPTRIGDGTGTVQTTGRDEFKRLLMGSGHLNLSAVGSLRHLICVFCQLISAVTRLCIYIPCSGHLRAQLVLSRFGLPGLFL